MATPDPSGQSSTPHSRKNSIGSRFASASSASVTGFGGSAARVRFASFGGVGGNKSFTSRFNAAQILSTVQPAKHFNNNLSSAPSAMESEFCESACDGHRAVCPAPLRLTLVSRDRISSSVIPHLRIPQRRRLVHLRPIRQVATHPHLRAPRPVDHAGMVAAKHLAQFFPRQFRKRPAQIHRRESRVRDAMAALASIEPLRRNPENLLR